MGIRPNLKPAPSEPRMEYRYILSVILCVVFSGCAFMALEKEVALLDQTSLLQGTISNTSSHKKPLIVLLYQLLGNEKRLVAYSIHHTPGLSRLSVCKVDISLLPLRTRMKILCISH